MATINVNAADVVKIAVSEIGYKEKATNYNLDNPASNIGSGNWTKYGRDLASAGYYGGSKNGYAWCFTAGTLILTNKGYKRIEDIKVGDKVLNAYGDRFNNVVFNEPHKDEVLDVKVYGILPFSVTPDHPFLSQKRRDKYHRGKGYYGYGFNTVDSLNKNDVCISPITKIEYENHLSYDELWTLGYYVGDGYKHHGNRYKICGGDKKVDIIRQHVDAREEKLYKSRSCYEFDLHKTNHEELFELLNDCGNLATNKRVPTKILFGSKETKKAFLDGYMAADGYDGSKFNSVSYELVAGITKLYNDLGYGCSINIRERNTTGKIWDNRINDYRYFNQQPYIINCAVNYNQDMNHQCYSVDDVNIYLPIKKKDELTHTDEVWTITTDGDHTYLANNLAVHNCDQFVDWCFYQACGKDKVAAEYIECQSGIYGAGCVNSAGYYKSAGRWANKPSVGAQIFFYVGGSINHTGIVESFDNTNVYTIEGNTSDMVARRTYNIYDSSIAGYGIPRYGVVNKGSTTVSNVKVKNTESQISMPDLSKGCTGKEVETLQIMLQAKKYNIGDDGVDGDFGSQTENAVKLFQATNKLVADGEVGKNTWTKLLRS